MFASIARLKRAFRGFGRARDGSAAVEFGFVVVPFFLLTFGLAEVALLGLAQTSLNFAVADAGRQIRTGQAQLSGVTRAEIVDRICNRLNRIIMMNCEDTLFVDVERFDSFVDVQGQADPMAGGDLDDSGFGYNPGDPSDIVVVRAFYRWSLITPMFQQILGNVSGGERIIVSTMMFRNEPYE